MQIFGDLLSHFRSKDEFIDADGFIAKGKRKTLCYLIFIIPLVIASVFSISVSLYPMTFQTAIQAVIDAINGKEAIAYEDWIMRELVVNTYIPRAIAGVAVGATLAVCGAVMQSAIKNPLADPYTTGISSGAMFGMTLAVVAGISFFPGTELGNIINAFIFALIPTAVIILFTLRRKTTPTTMILIGIGVMYVFTAATTLMKYTASSSDIAKLYSWGVGTLAEVSWDSIPFVITAAFVAIGVFMYMNGTINVIGAGDNIATALGVNPKRCRQFILVVVSMCTATVVCFTGTIGFVGLIIPHVARMFFGSNLKYVIPASAVLGALLLVCSDMISRVIGTSGLPVGVITTVIGSPLFIYFLVEQRRNGWS